jgi:UDPglucose--hexose-1-phosphate uridylyltransferase
MAVTHLGPVWAQAPAGGIHEVLVLSPDHHATWADLSDEQAALVMAAIRDRVEEHSRHRGLRYTQTILNVGREAGASLEHPHGQLLGIPFVPGEITEESRGFDRFEGGCLLCATAEAEQSVGHRVVQSDDRALVVCPFWSGTPYEMLVVPMHHAAHLHESEPRDVAAMGRTVRDALRRLRDFHDDPAYNVVFHAAPFSQYEDFHWHVHLIPRLTTVAGFEQGTGVMINIVAPEHAAQDLRTV